ncbi:MAG: T9SS type A sorting domain-containing protein [candidate division KSB1 bacterium]|nr:T9SS type A sorting domain-containing protein [candidate division KSB1 bacterium]MDZ7302864.1 T9SS type A sorting domain-containing protein [candidate division KSB1 bacterium]MDZ7310439.1 T9SS type A sorting domain-containing protein [candidate division KSB1 bacterium]
MKPDRARAIFCSLLLCSIAYPQPASKISVRKELDNTFSVAVNPKIHHDYGLSYPMTYQFSIPPHSTGLAAHRKFSVTQEWTRIPEKTSADFFNGIEAVRFDHANHVAYLSVAFSNASDSVFLKIADQAGTNVAMAYAGMSRYYDNRDAAVTVTADDWHPSFDAYFLKALSIFRKYRLYVSTAIVTEWCDSTTWKHIQAQLDSGYVEAAAHGRNHIYAPYPDVAYEVTGAKEDIIKNLDLPASFRNGNREYVYVWIAPYGNYDEQIESAVSRNQYLVSRLVNFGFGNFSKWNDRKKMYDPIGVVHEMGPLWGGVTDTTILNNDFDAVVAAGGVYHVMCHPHVIQNDWGKRYIWSHLEHISNRKNLWYVNLGHLYLYHLLQDVDSTPVTFVADLGHDVPANYVLSQNYPNPFNPATTIQYQLPKAGRVCLNIIDVWGQLVATLVDEYQSAGHYSVVWNATGYASGLYFYQIYTGEFLLSRRMILLH